MRNRMVGGGSFAQSTVLAVWKKAAAIPGEDPGVARRDTCGARIEYLQYGKQTTYGWEVDHIKPLAKNGNDDLSNLQPLHWENNSHKSDDYPNWTCGRKR